MDAFFLTHTHRDHIACLDDLHRLIAQMSLLINSNYLMIVNPSKKALYSNGSLYLQAKHTHGHSLGGMTYIIMG